jgi:hypothetical protein
MNQLSKFLFLFSVILMSFFSCKKDDSSSNNNSGNTNNGTDYVLLIENGAQSLSIGSNLNYSAVLVKSNGEVTPATGVTWTSSDQKIASINANGVVSTSATGAITVNASVTVGGKTYTASVPLVISTPSVFAVAPSAIIWGLNDGPLQLEPIYFGSGTPNFSYASNKTNIASVSNSGLVSFNAIGNCEITVTASGLNGSPEIIVPVMVVGAPAVPLPVTKVVITPSSKDVFRGETIQFSAKAYNSNNVEVSTPITWKVLEAELATINDNGLFTAKQIGSVSVQAIAQGMIGQAEVVINPDTIVSVEPIYASIAAGESQQFSAKVYKINRANRNLTEITPSPSITWEIPSFGLSIFDIGTVDNTGKVTLKQSAMPVMQTFVIAHVGNSETIEPGVGTIMVGISEPCNCGAKNPNVKSISVTQTNISLSFGGQQQIEATALDANQSPVADANIVFCSDNEAVVAVDNTGMLSATGMGSAKITICVGNIKTTVNVTVSF